MLRYVIHYHLGVVQKVKLGPFPTPFPPPNKLLARQVMIFAFNIVEC